MAETVEVWLGYGASDGQQREVGEIFEAEGIPVCVRTPSDAPMVGNGAGFTIFVFLLGGTVGHFFAGYFSAAGADAWAKTKELVAKLKRNHFDNFPSEPPTSEGLVVVKDVRRRIQVNLTTELPDEAFRKLAELEIGDQEDVAYNWSEGTGEWEPNDLSRYEDLSPRTKDDVD